MGSDIVYFGCPVHDLYLVFRNCLRTGGRGLIIIPDRKNYAELFVKEVEEEHFTIESEELEGDFYKQAVLENI